MQAALLQSDELTAWVRSAREGDREAFERILIAHQRLVLRVALRMLGNLPDAQDAAQDVFLKLHRSLHQFHDAKSFTPWLYRMTVNTCLDVIRTRRHHWQLEDTRSVPPSAESALLLQERKAAVDRALLELPEKERAAIVLREVEGLSTAEVAAILESSETTVRSQIYKARLRLRKRTNELLGGQS